MYILLKPLFSRHKGIGVQFNNDPIGYADLILNGDPETYLKTVTEYKPLDS